MLTTETSWYFLGGAAATGAYWVVSVFNANINSDSYLHVVAKILSDKNVVRALKLTTAAGNVPIAVATRAAILASVSREYDETEPSGYRNRPRTSMDSVRQRIHNRYDEAFTTISKPLARAFFLSIPSLPLCAFTLTCALLETEKDWQLIGTACAILLVLLWIGRTHLAIVASRNAGFKFLWPALELSYQNRQTLSAMVESSKQTPDDTNKHPWALSTLPLTLEILEPNTPRRTFQATEPIIKIGTLKTAHLQLSAEGVGRMHAVIEMANGVATIIDLGTASGTRVNGELVAKKDLSNGDVIAVGQAEIVVRLENSGTT